ncbi:glycosyltransferase family 4 protein [Candidatus Parvarchaeota archaeon]|nr:glycosyltransferase family 4 protein [Candidatus Acidifodinimicrobium mancum]
MENNKKLKVVFVTSDTKIVTGGPVCLLNYLRNAPKNIDISIIEFKNPHVSSDYNLDYSNILSSKDFNYTGITLPKILSNTNKSIMFRALKVFGLNFIYPLYFKVKHRRLLEITKKADIIYFISHIFIPLFKYNGNIVFAAGHSFVWESALGTKISLSNKVKSFFTINFKLNSINAFHFLSDRDKQYLNNSRLKISNRIKYKVVLPNGVDTDIFYPIKEYNKSKKVKFLFLPARECKGVKIVIEAWKRIKDKSNMELHIAGGGDLAEYVRKEAEMSNFIYHGVLPLDELAELYRSCDVFVYPTGCDTFGLVVLEALSSGLYVIASESLRGIFDDFEKLNHLEYQPKDPETIAKRMEEIVKDKDILNHDRMKQYQHVKDNYSWEIISKKLFDFFFEVSKKEGKI